MHFFREVIITVKLLFFLMSGNKRYSFFLLKLIKVIIHVDDATVIYWREKKPFCTTKIAMQALNKVTALNCVHTFS